MNARSSPEVVRNICHQRQLKGLGDESVNVCICLIDDIGHQIVGRLHVKLRERIDITRRHD